jgi:Domain of Unknown Function (DUF1206)
MTATHSARGAAREAAHSRPLKALTRFGFITYGVMHALVGWLALQIAWGHPSAEGDQSGAFQTLAGKPLGKVLLTLVVIGLAAMTIWQVLSAAVGHTDEQGGRRTAERVFSAARAIVYAVLAWTALRIVTGSGASSAQSQQKATSSMLSSTGGRWLVGVAGIVVVGFGIGMAGYGLKAAFERKLELAGTATTTRRTARNLGRVGYAAKGVAFAIVGVLLVIAAVHQDPSRSRGLDEALRTLAAQPFGPWLLSLVAIGFVAFAAFCLFQARYRKV